MVRTHNPAIQIRDIGPSLWKTLSMDTPVASRTLGVFGQAHTGLGTTWGLGGDGIPWLWILAALIGAYLIDTKRPYSRARNFIFGGRRHLRPGGRGRYRGYIGGA